MSLGRDRPPFRADHVGSLLRPAKLAAAREDWRGGKLAAAELKAAEDAAIRDAIALQQGCGLDGITDGEFRRDYWHLDFMWGLDGVEPSADEVAAPFSNDTAFVARAARITGKVAYPASGVMRDAVAFLVAETDRTAKVTIPAPTTFRHRMFRDMIDRDAYPDLDAFWVDLGQAYNDAMQDYAARGLTYLQLDDVNSAMLCDENFRERYRGQGDDPDAILGIYISAINTAVAGRPPQMAVTTHMCRGNFRSEHMGAGGYDSVAERLFAEVDVDGFFMEYDDDRSGGFEPLRFLPKGKQAVLGIVTSKRPELEPKDDLKRRIDQAAKFAPLDQLCLSPQCGFASTREGNALSEDQQKAKLELVVSVAEEIWG